MPFTPFHLGPAILIGLIFRKYIDLPTFIVASLIVDFRATLVFFSIIKGSLHGILHTFLSALVLGVLTGLTVYKLRGYLEPLMKFFRIKQLKEPKNYLLAGITGTAIHVLLDSILYTDIQPFAPFNFNPFYGMVSGSLVYLFCIATFFSGMVYYIYIYQKLHG